MGDIFTRIFERKPDLAVQAPGRVNLIGEHTDYNEGFVFPVAIDRTITVIAARGRRPRIRAYSLDFAEDSRFDLFDIEKSEDAAWSNYLRGVLVEYRKRGFEIGGMDLMISGDIPIGSGLSSSAAFETAIGETVRILNEIEIEKTEMALLCQAAERNFVGVQCGIMDQFISTLAREGSALFLDCRDLSYSHVPLDPSARIVVCDTRVQRSLDVSAYNRRRAECEKAVAILNEKLGGKKALRDVSVEELEDCRDLLPEVLFNRVHHVVHENNRVLTAVEALRKGEISRFGILLYESHYSLKKRYEVSCRELDILVELAAGTKGTIGARMTGAGFGGCTVNLVEADAVPDFCKTVSEGYRGKTGIEAAIYACQPSEGVRYQWLQAAK